LKIAAVGVAVAALAAFAGSALATDPDGNDDSAPVRCGHAAMGAMPMDPEGMLERMRDMPGEEGYPGGLAPMRTDCSRDVPGGAAQTHAPMGMGSDVHMAARSESLPHMHGAGGPP
jgi:hypothetical protein